MAKYLLLYAGGKMPESEEETAQVMKAWDSWFSELGGALADGGNPFTSDSKTIASDGTVTDAKATASGYSVIEANSLDEATKLAGGCPVLLGGAQVMVFETFNVM